MFVVWKGLYWEQPLSLIKQTNELRIQSVQERYNFVALIWLKLSNSNIDVKFIWSEPD